MPYERLTIPLAGGGYASNKPTAETGQAFMLRYIKERNRLGAYEDTEMLPGELPTLKCNTCDFAQANDTCKLFCHAWHRQTDSYGYCYRAKPKLPKSELKEKK